MVTCQHCADLLWDHLYGLLEDEDSEGVHNPLAWWAGCQARLIQVESQRRRLLEAARLDIDIPPFLVPQADREPVSLGAERGTWGDRGPRSTPHAPRLQW